MEKEEKREQDLLYANTLRRYAVSNNIGIESTDKVFKSLSKAKAQTRSNIRNALKEPTLEKNVQILQDAILNYRNSNGILKQFINYQSNILTNDHFIVPIDMSKFNNKEELWKKELEVAKYLENFKIKKNFKWMFKELITFGELYIYTVEHKDGVMIIKIPQSICIIIGKDSNMQNRFGINLSKIKEDSLSYFPKEIQDAWNKLKNGTLKKEELIDGKYFKVSEFGTAFIIDEWDIKGIPYFSHILDSLLSLEDAMGLDENNAFNDNFKLIHQQVPMDDKGNYTIEHDAVGIYHENIKNVLPKGIGIVSTPMKLNYVSLGDSKVKNLDYVTKIKKNIYDVAGFNDDLFNGNKSSNEAIAMGSTVDTLLPLSIQGMFSDWINSILRRSSKTKNWKVVFCESTEYNKLNLVKNERENLAVYGSKKKYLALQGYTPLEALNIILNEDMLGIGELMNPMQTSHTLSKDDEKGRPSNESNPDVNTETGESE